MPVRSLSLLITLALLSGLASASAQFQPIGPPDIEGFTQREDLTEAAPIEGAQRILRFVQVSDAHIIDDDAPYPMRQGILDPLFGPVTSSAERPQEEYSDELLLAMIESINRVHEQDALDFVLNTGDNIDNELENELMRFKDLWDGTLTTTGPVSGLTCVPDGQSTSVEDDGNDETEQCTYLPADLGETRPGLAGDVPWYVAFGNHDGLIQGNVPIEPGFQELAAEFGRYFVMQDEFVGMHFDAGTQCVGGAPAGVASDHNGHGFGFAGDRLCDGDPDNDGYYSLSMRGVHVIVLDTVNDDFFTANEDLQGLLPTTETTLGRDIIGGYAEGAVDPAQFEWMKQEIADNQDKLVFLFSHHTINSMFTDQAGEQCGPPGCLHDIIAAAGFKTAADLEAELTQHDNVVAWIGGHTHQHRIQPKLVEGAPGGFWNVETSSIIDMPQESRVIELWQTPDGKAFLRMQRLLHDDEEHRAIAQGDDQFDAQTAAGEDIDRDVLLWIDVPPQVALTPQPSLPRAINIFATSTGAAEVGEPYALEVSARDTLLGINVSGLQVTLDVGFPGDNGFEQVVPPGTVANETRPGHYSITFTPPQGITHFATITATDPSGLYPEKTQVISIIVTGEVEEDEGSPMPILLVAFALMVAVAVRRQNR